MVKGTVRYEKRSAANGVGVAVLTMDSAPVNALSDGVRTGLTEHLKAALADDSVKAIVVTGAHGSFSAGADISEFASGIQGPPLPMVCNELEASTKPVVAAIDGVSLGGGCEVALGCHYRLASTRAMAGLPEVNLGLLPGAGGTQRVPRLVGVEAAVDFMCSGAPAPAAKAVKIGIYDEVKEGDNAAVVMAAIDFAAGKVGTDLGPRRLSTFAAKNPGAESLEKKRKQYGASRKGEEAPQAIITCAAAATEGNFEQGMAVEQKEFLKLLMGNQSKALQYMFFAQRACAKVPGLTAKPGPLNAVGIVGSGLMGGGIAMCCAEAGMKVTLLDIDQANLERGMGVIKKNYQRSVDRKSKTQAKVDEILSRITPSSSYDSLAGVDIVIEAVFENMALKKKIFAQLDQVCKPGCILSSNTSRLDIDEIANATKRPQDVIGCHFFSPANVMPLLENVRGPRTGPVAIATAMELGKKIKKVTCLVGNCNGFIANRIMGVSQSDKLMNSGLMPAQVDAASEAYGMKMGPARMGDLVGLDLFGRERAETGAADPKTVVTDAMYAANRFGQKNGKGFYKYDDKLKCMPDPDADALIHAVWKNRGVQPMTMSQEDIIDSLYLPVVNEGFKCLEEGMASRPSDIDVCAVFGYNWPRYHGGPMQWATALGLPTVLDKLEKMKVEPSALLRECVKNNWKLNSKDFTKRVEQAWNTTWSKSMSKL